MLTKDSCARARSLGATLAKQDVILEICALLCTPLVFFSLPHSVTLQIYNEHLPRTVSDGGLERQQTAPTVQGTTCLLECQAVRRQRGCGMCAEQMFLPSVSGGQRRFHRLFGTVVWLVYCFQTLLAPSTLFAAARISS